MDNIQILPLTLADKDGFLSALNALSPTNLSNDAFEEIYANRRAVNIITIVATVEKEVVGTASYFIETKFLHQGGKVMHIEDVAVKQELHGKGIGKKMIDFLNDLAKQLGCYKVILNCSEKNVAFYEKCHFRKHELEMRKDIL